jgi:hypothetical protein
MSSHPLYFTNSWLNVLLVVGFSSRKHMKGIPTISFSALLALSLASLGAFAQAHHQSGIIGQTALGEICDLDGNCVPNLVPMHLLIHSDQGRFIADIATDADALFEIALKPDSYFLTPYTLPVPSNPSIIAIGGPVSVTVRKKEYAVTLVSFVPFSPQLPRPPVLPPPPSPAEHVP